MKRFASVCMAAMMLTSAVSYLPVVSTAVYAEDSEEQTFQDLTYVVVDDDHVEITGCSYEAVEVEIPAEIAGKKVTVIRSHAFDDHDNLTFVSVSEGVTEIGDYAFYHCDNLTSISLPQGLKKIGEFGIDCCFALQSLTIPGTVEEIGHSAFGTCHALAEVTIEEGVKMLPSNAFWDSESLTSISIPSSVESIGAAAFHNSGITSISISEGVKTIGDYAFEYCKLESVTLPSTVTSIGVCAFQYCQSLTEATLAGVFTEIPNELFYDCEALTAVTVPDSVISIGESAFRYNYSLAAFKFPSGLAQIGSYAFQDCDAMTEAKIPDSVESIGTDAFLSCDNLADVTVPSSVKQFGAHVFVATPWMEAKRASEGVVIRNNIVLDGYSAALEDEDVVLPGNVTAITNAAFSDSSVKSVVIPEGCVSIGSGAFNPCHEMEKITIPESVTEFGENIFNCKEGFYIIGKEGSAAETYASENSIPFQVEGSADDTRTMKFEVVDDHAVLTNYYGKEEAVIPASYKDVPVTEIGNDAFKNTAVQSVVIPDSVTKIGNWAFYGCGSLSQIVIPASVKEIGEYAFDSTGLASITVPGTVEKIGVSAFGSCKSLLEATVSEGIKELPERMFTMCESLDTVSLPKTLTLIGREAFYQTAIPGISIPETVTEIGDYAFAGSKLAEVTIPGSVAKIGSSAFEGCSNMASATMKDGVKELCDYAFKNCEFLEIVNIPASCTAIHANCFEGTAWLKAKQAENPLVIVNGILIDASTASGKVIVPNTVTAIAGGSFVNNEENPVTSILIPTSVTLIEDSFYWWRWTGYDITIYCYKGSEAEKFCKSNGIAYLMFGDVNDDKELNLKDAVLIRRYIAGGWSIKLDEYIGDINGDGTLNLKDVVLIRRFIAGGWNVKF